MKYSKTPFCCSKFPRARVRRQFRQPCTMIYITFVRTYFCAQLNNNIVAVQYLRSPYRCFWICKSSGMWRGVIWYFPTFQRIVAPHPPCQEVQQEWISCLTSKKKALRPFETSINIQWHVTSHTSSFFTMVEVIHFGSVYDYDGGPG